jgi:uncharacterized protein (TIGR03118 family)
MKKLMIAVCTACVAAYASAWRAEADGFLQTDLVSNIPGLAQVTDPTLQNPWGVSFNPATQMGLGSPFWISDQVNNAATLYAVNGSGVSKVNINPPSGFVGIPTPAGGPQGPTGQVFNFASPNFVAGNGSGGSAPAVFMFANLNGTIAAWNPTLGPSAFIQATTAGAVYTGLALATSSFPILPGVPGSQSLLYAANDAGPGSIDVFNSSFGLQSLPAGAFATPAPIKALGLVPFNVQVLNGSVYVTYAPVGRTAQQNAALGAGAVAIFNLDGSTKPNTAFIAGSHLAAPWGLAIAPAAFGPFAGDLLVGNFSYINSGINIFDPTGAWEGTILIAPGSGNTAGGLWALEVGTGPNNGFPNTLFFTDGINGERDGLFGSLVFATNGVPPVTGVPEPATWAMMLLGFAGLGFASRHSRRKVAMAMSHA